MSLRAKQSEYFTLTLTLSRQGRGKSGEFSFVVSNSRNDTSAVWLSSFRSFARILFLPLFQELFLAFFMSRVCNAAVYRTNLSTFRGSIPANALSALGRVDDIYRFPFFDGLVFTFWFAGPAANAFICDFVSHLLNLTSLDFIKTTIFYWLIKLGYVRVFRAGKIRVQTSFSALWRHGPVPFVQGSRPAGPPL